MKWRLRRWALQRGLLMAVALLHCALAFVEPFWTSQLVLINDAALDGQSSTVPQSWHAAPVVIMALRGLSIRPP